MAIRKPDKTKIEEIVAYWETRQDESGLGVDWSEAHERCWRCGQKRSLQRCHIIPAHAPFNGPDSPSNMVLLCKACHQESPEVNDPDEIWRWIRATAVPLYDIFWINRSLQECFRQFGELDNEQTAAVEYAIEVGDFKKHLNTVYDKLGLHFGVGFTTSSRAYAMRKVFQLCVDEYRRSFLDRSVASYSGEVPDPFSK